MACCLVFSYLFTAAMWGWRRLTGRSAADPGFAPPARRSGPEIDNAAVPAARARQDNRHVDEHLLEPCG
jgi:hypothetical protein